MTTNAYSPSPGFTESCPPDDRQSFNYVADLGCGSGDQLIKAASSRQDVRGLGSDAADGAIKIADKAVVETGLAHHITITQGDATALAARPECTGVDLVMTFMMGHGFWPRSEAVASLRRVREIFPDLKQFLIADSTRTTTYANRRCPSSHDIRVCPRCAGRLPADT
ncbi:class I SAM-dependent methyltransferase [Streptomyces ehimensis]|uniref:Class I SAM-dependent methyltransferase n=1 Tax=Streptomyces ehimensis TaxID=68195 RepID=A0ABV9BU13_9ACTN